MGSFGLGVGIIGFIVLMGILFSGVAAEASETYSDMNIDSVFDFDEVLEEIDANVMLKMDGAFEDKNLPMSVKKMVHYVSRGAIDGLYSSFYIGKFINDLTPGLYEWVRENLFLVVIILCIIMFPGVINIFVICLLGIILIIKERFIVKEHKTPKNKWRGYNGK